MADTGTYFLQAGEDLAGKIPIRLRPAAVAARPHGHIATGKNLEKPILRRWLGEAGHCDCSRGRHTLFTLLVAVSAVVPPWCDGREIEREGCFWNLIIAQQGSERR